MRDIRFRGKTKEGEWVYGYVDATTYKDLVVIHSEATTYEVLSETVGEYTGLKDANGKDIYEGDILRVSEYYNESFLMEKSEDFYDVFSLEDVMGRKMKEYVTKVSWEEGLFLLSADTENDTYFSVLWGDMRKSHPIFIFEVIGNIHDNPELL